MKINVPKGRKGDAILDVLVFLFLYYIKIALADLKGDMR